MLYTVDDLSTKFNVSKVTIYSKLKLDNIKPYVLKDDGKTKVKEEALNLIKESLKIKNDEENNSTVEDVSTILNLSESLIGSLNTQIDFLKLQLQEKDKQLEMGDKLLENMQILLKQEQDNNKKELLLEQHFKEIDNRLTEIIRNNEPKSNKESFFKRFLRLKKT